MSNQTDKTKSLFEEWENAPKANEIVKKGTVISIKDTWGYDKNDDMTDAKDIELILKQDSTIKECWYMLIDKYEKTVTYPRRYFYEGAYERRKVLEFIIGT